ncbi:MAG TPA: Mur ligase family protein [Candidatus Saccharimonadales bacterium]|nr:Mur ligase family protein [Candidatus Saccharimonadales bacterium]
MKVMGAVFSLYRPRYVSTLVYMLQNTEYHVEPYLKWYWRTQNFSTVMHRRTLDRTKAARLLKWALAAGMVAQIAAGIVLIVLGSTGHLTSGVYFGAAALVGYPVVWAHLAVVPLWLGRLFIVMPNERKLIKKSEQIFAGHPGVKIAVAGSYGKTTMKELLATVLSEGKKVAATPGNKNVSISHAHFAKKLAGDEDILIIEYGEGEPGDVPRFARTTHPTHGVITGLAPAHLDKYKSLSAAGKDIFALADYLGSKQVYVNGESPATKDFVKKGYEVYSAQGALGWKVSEVELGVDGTSFLLSKGKKQLELHSGLLGAHNVGSLTFVAALALELGLSEQQVHAGIAKTVPFEHRMQPYQMNGGWVIDDTYNGNIEGIRAGTQLLKALPAQRKTYVTPGLVDQGKEAKTVHEEMGELIAAAAPDRVVLMKNSATKAIQAGLRKGGFKGKVDVENDPLEFYTNLPHYVAAGDVVMMQNDWTDNYA